jgi:HPt (histidine-containing phosphotransfer) domain-containing protein
VSSPQSLIDEAELSVQTYDDPALKVEVLQMMLEQAPVLLNAIEMSEGPTRADVAHRLRGSALALAATPLAEAAATLEADPGNAAALVHLRLVLHDTLHEVRRLIRLND